MSQLWSKTARRLLSRIHKTGLEQELNRLALETMYQIYQNDQAQA